MEHVSCHMPSPWKEKNKKKKRGRASQSITCHCLSLDGWMMDDCIFSNNTKTLPMWETFCTGKNCVCVCVWAINISVFFHLNWQLTLCPYMQDMTLGLRVNPFYLTPWVFGRKVRNPRELQCSVNVFIPSFYPECRSCSIHAKLLLNSQALQMIRLCLCDLHNIHSCWCDASQIRKSPQKWDDESLQRCTVGREDGGEGGGGGRGLLPPTHSLLQSLGPPLGL